MIGIFILYALAYLLVAVIVGSLVLRFNPMGILDDDPMDDDGFTPAGRATLLGLTWIVTIPIAIIVFILYVLYRLIKFLGGDQ